MSTTAKPAPFRGGLGGAAIIVAIAIRTTGRSVERPYIASAKSIVAAKRQPNIYSLLSIHYSLT
jgi:hypothetical protein